MQKKIALAAALIGALTCSSAFAHDDHDKLGQLIKYRQSGYSFMAWNMGKIKNNVENPGSFNKDQVIAAANAIAAIANSGMGALYAPGTDKGTGWKPTQVKAEFFQQPEKVKEVAVAFNKEANELAAVAQTGNPQTIKAQLGKVGETCKKCHDAFRHKD